MIIRTLILSIFLLTLAAFPLRAQWSGNLNFTAGGLVLGWWISKKTAVEGTEPDAAKR